MDDHKIRTRVIKAPWGAELEVDLDDRSLEPDFLATGVYEAVELDVLSSVITTGMAVLEVGACFGYHSVLASHRVGQHGVVVAVEPEAANIALLRRNLSRNGCRNVVLVEAAASDADGTTRLCVSSTNRGRHSLVGPNVTNGQRWQDVAAITVDSIVARHLGGRPVDLLKIDAEGAEGMILDGASTVLAQDQLLVWMELWPDGLLAAGTSHRVVLDRMRLAGFTVQGYAFDDKLMRPADPDSLERGEGFMYALFAKGIGTSGRSDTVDVAVGGSHTGPGNASVNRRYLFPTTSAEVAVPELLSGAYAEMARLMPDGNPARFPGWAGPDRYAELVDRYGQLPAAPAADIPGVVNALMRDFLAGTTIWRSTDLQYNIGAAVNVAATALYALGLDLNVYLISDGQAGNAVLAERAISRILATLSGVDPTHARGLFTFGGTGTLAYAVKAGIRKVAPESIRRGVPDDLHVLITDDAHFSHETVCDWLGIGAERLIVTPADPTDRRSQPALAEQQLRACIERGGRVAAILINGGTTYDHTIDDIAAFAQIRDRLVRDYRLTYRPHLHVDSVIGWSWLFLHGLEPDAYLSLGASLPVRDMLREQHRRIAEVRLADSFGLDFHKGIGGCPVDCSFVQFNNRADLSMLRKGLGLGGGLYQLAEEVSDISPVDYTLETSRAGGKALAALGAMHTVGQSGFQQILADLVGAATTFRTLVDSQPEMTAINPHALGYQTMVRLTAPGTVASIAELSDPGPGAAERVRAGNAYLKSFFEWDNTTRMNTNAGGVVYSFSSRYVTTASGANISGLKFYPTNPHIGAQHMREAVQLLTARKAEYDRIHAGRPA